LRRDRLASVEAGIGIVRIAAMSEAARIAAGLGLGTRLAALRRRLIFGEF